MRKFKIRIHQVQQQTSKYDQKNSKDKILNENDVPEFLKSSIK